MSNRSLTARAYNRLKFSTKAPTADGMITREACPAFMALMCYFHALIFAFPNAGSNSARLKVEQFT